MDVICNGRCCFGILNSSGVWWCRKYHNVCMDICTNCGVYRKWLEGILYGNGCDCGVGEDGDG